MSKLIVSRQFRVRTEGHGRKAVRSGTEPVGSVPRVAKLLALAIHFDQMIQDGVVADQPSECPHDVGLVAAAGMLDLTHDPGVRRGSGQRQRRGVTRNGQADLGGLFHSRLGSASDRGDRRSL